MHEMSICRALLKQVEACVQAHHGHSVTKIILSIGALSGVEASLLEGAFNIAKAGTVAEHAQLICETVEIKVKCADCGEITTPPLNRFLCQKCKSRHTEVISGADMMLKSVEIKEDKENKEDV